MRSLVLPPLLSQTGVKPEKRKASEITLFLVQEIDDSSAAQDGAGALDTCIVRPGPKASSVSPVISESEYFVFSTCSMCKLPARALFIHLG